MKRALLLGAALASPALASPALAQSAPVSVTLPEIVSSATRTPLPVEQIPAGVSVVDRQDIETRGYASLTDALSALPGMHVVQQGGPGGVSSVFMRGANSNHVLVLRDGFPINDPSASNGLFNFGTETLADIERIEVIRGPMSSLYGSGAIGGVVNLISRRGNGTPRLQAEVTGGIPRAFAGQATFSGVSGPVDYALTYENQSTVGDDVIPRRMAGYTGERDGYRTNVGTLNVGYTPVDGTRLSVFLRERQSVFGYDNLGYPAFDDPNQIGRDRNLQTRVGGESTLFDGVWRTGLFVGYAQDDRRYSNRLDLDDPNFASENSSYTGKRTDVQWSNTVRLPSGGVLSETFATFGYQYTRDAAVVHLNDSGYQQDVDTHAASNAGYVGLQGQLFTRLTLTGNLRYENPDDFNDATTWRVGGVFAVPEVASRIHAAYGTGFRAPTLFDRFGIGSFGFHGNPNLKPERSNAWEAGVSSDVPAFGNTRFATLGVTWFDSRVRDLIQNTADFSSLENIGRAKMHGIESELVLRPDERVELRLAYTWTDARDAETDQRLLRRPENQFSVSATLRPLPQFSVVPEVLVYGRFRDALVNDAGYPAGRGTASGGTIVNLTMNYALTDNITLIGRGRNLGNSRFEPASGFALPGPSFMAGARISF